MPKVSPYKGLVPYAEKDAGYFFGRDRERRLISAALRASRLTVLYGESGAGKSSVLAAGVAHDLRDDRDYALILFRSWRDEPVTGLMNAVRDRVSKLPGFNLNVSFQTPGDALQCWSEATKRSLLIVLDQFEEYFQYHPSEIGVGNLVDELPRLLNRSDLPVNFLIAVREDALCMLDQFKGSIPSLFDNLVRIEHLTANAAEDAIVKPLWKFNEDLHAGKFSGEGIVCPVEIDRGLAAKVVSEIVSAQGGEQSGVQAAYLQLVMTRWWEREISNGSARMKPETLHELGGIRSIVERYLEDTLTTLSPQEKELAAEAFRYMVTPAGRKIAQTISELGGSTHIGESVSRATLEGLLEKLQKARVLTSVPPPRGSLPDERCYEFAHDVVARAALEWRKQFRRTLELSLAKKREEEARRIAEEEARQASKFRRLAWALGTILILALAASGIALWQWRTARRSEDQAKRGENTTKLALAEVEREKLAATSAANNARLSESNARQAEKREKIDLLQAQRSAAIAKSRELLEASLASQETDPELAVLLAAHSIAAEWPWERRAFPESEDQLHRALMASRVRLTLSGHTGDVYAVAWSKDGRRVATASGDKTAIVWDAETGKEVLILRGHALAVVSVAWSPDGKRVATAGYDHTVVLWDADVGKELRTLHDFSGPVICVAWSPDGKRLATGAEESTLSLGRESGAKVWDAETGKEVLSLSSKTVRVNSMAWSPDGKRLAAANADATTQVWDAETGRELLTLRGHILPVNSVAWSPDAKFLATASVDHTAIVWDSESGKTLLTLRAHSREVNSVAWSPDGKRLATGSGDNSTKVWASDSGQELLNLRGHHNSVNGVAWSRDGRLATGSADKTARIWETESSLELVTLRRHSDRVWSVAWSPDGKHLASGSRDKTAKVWDAGTGKELLTLSGHTDSVDSVAWSPEGSRLATASSDGTTTVWDAKTGKQIVTVRGPKLSINCVAWSPDGKRLVTGAWDSTAKLWDTQTGKELLTLTGHTNPVDAAAWSPDGKRLVTGAWDSTARLWDTQTGRELRNLVGDSSSSTSVSSFIAIDGVAWSPDGKHVATASWEQTAKVWNVETGRELLTLAGHSDFVSSVAWSPDGKRLATGSRDTTAKVWDAESGKELLTLSSHTGPLFGVAWSPDGKCLATADGDGTVQVYAMDIHVLMALARRRVTAHPSEEGCKKYLHLDKCPPIPELSK